VPGVLRRADLQDEQGDGDGEHRIAEDEPRRIAFCAEPSAGSGWAVGRGGRCDRTEPADHQGDACSSPGAVAEGGLAGATVTFIILPLGLVDEAGEEVTGGPIRPGLKWLKLG
jgi:hypothetical protein